MPIPQPNDNEDENKFMTRCMGNDKMKEEYPDSKQRAAVCLSTFRRKKKNHSSENKKEDKKDK